jgi:hypothetical protein
MAKIFDLPENIFYFWFNITSEKYHIIYYKTIPFKYDYQRVEKIKEKVAERLERRAAKQAAESQRIGYSPRNAWFI